MLYHFCTGLLFDPYSVVRVDSKWDEFAPIMFGYHGLSPKIKPSLSAAIKKHYLNNNGVRDSNVHDIGRIFSDAHFNHPLHKSAAFQSRIHPVYLYYYSYKTSFGFFQIFSAMTKSLPRLFDWGFALSYRWIVYNILGYDEHHYGLHKFFDFMSNLI